MLNKHKENNLLYPFYLLWFSQLVSQIGSSMSSFAMTLFILERTGSAFLSALLSISFYIPYSLTSLISGVFSDRCPKKRMMQMCDSAAAAGSLLILLLLLTGKLEVWLMCGINALNGICNAFQNPASETAMNRLISADDVQKTSGLRSLSWSLNVFLHPLMASALYPLIGLGGILITDLFTFLFAFSILQFLIVIPESRKTDCIARQDSFGIELREGFFWLKKHRIILGLILFMAAVNFNASAFDNALPVYLISLSNNTSLVGIVSSAAGAAMILSSLAVSILPEPKDRIRVIVLSMLFSLTADNFMMPFVRETPALVIAQFLGYLPVPLMNSSLTAVFQTEVPDEIQGRVYSCRNALQFISIPFGSLFSGLLIDRIAPEFFRRFPLNVIFTADSSQYAAFTIFLLGITGLLSCLIAAFWFFRQKKTL